MTSWTSANGSSRIAALRYPEGYVYCHTVVKTCSACGGPVEPTVLSGVVSLKRRRSALASGRVSALRSETCVRCGRTELFAEKPERLFSDLYREG
jgi:hypothetical protein